MTTHIVTSSRTTSKICFSCRYSSGTLRHNPTRAQQSQPSADDSCVSCAPSFKLLSPGLISSSLGKYCGGTERWSVKVGRDAAAQRFAFSTIRTTTAPLLLHIQQPHALNDDTTGVVPEKTHLSSYQPSERSWVAGMGDGERGARYFQSHKYVDCSKRKK